MKLEEIAEILNAEILCGKENLNIEIHSVFSCDLMSDVLAYANKKTVLLTGLTNAQVIRTAEMMDMCAVIFVRNKKPAYDIVHLAEDNNMALMSTELSMYTASGMLYSSGLSGVQIKPKTMEKVI